MRKPTKEELEDIKTRMKFDRELWARVGKTEECKTQAEMFRSWVALSGISYAKIENGEGFVWCPKHNKLEKIQLECGLSIEDAIELLAIEIPKHAEEVKKVRERIEKEMRGEKSHA